MINELKGVKVGEFLSDEIIIEISEIHKSNTYSKNPKIQKIGEGMNGRVYSYKNGQTEVAIKIWFKDTIDFLGVVKEPRFLEKLQVSSVYPRIYYYEVNEFMIVEKIEGELLVDIRESEIRPHKNWRKTLMYGMETALNHDIIPSDVCEENIMFTKEGKPKIIDVGDFSFKDEAEDVHLTSRYARENLLRRLNRDFVSNRRVKKEEDYLNLRYT